MKTLRVAEFVSPLHPDKICDRVSDMLVSFFLKEDKNSRVAIETMGGHGKFYVVGEVTCSKYQKQDELNNVIRENTKKFLTEILSEDSHNRDDNGDVKIPTIADINVIAQSLEISRGVDNGGAGDQGVMVGYACIETHNLMPLEYEFARRLNYSIYRWLHTGDGKTQITINGNNEIIDVVASFQNTDSKVLEEYVRSWASVLPVTKHCLFHINPAGEWSHGGFDADTGLTGRKIVVDAYGPRIPVGGGAFSGKDPSKVDRSAAYMARYISCKVCEKLGAFEAITTLGYAIGVADPVISATLMRKNEDWEVVYPTHSTLGITSDEFLYPKNIISQFNLLDFDYSTIKWGHFGNGNIWDGENS